MTRLNAVLLIALVLCGLSLVSAQFQARQLFVQIEAQQALTRQLDIEWNQLQIDQTTWSKHSLIEEAAARDLHMQAAIPSRSQYITLPTQTGGAAELHDLQSGGAPK